MKESIPSNTNRASLYFNENWQRYLRHVRNNTLFHREMLSALQELLRTTMNGQTFSFVDVGCGDSSTIVPILAQHAIKKYIGIDAAQDILTMARENLGSLD